MTDQQETATFTVLRTSDAKKQEVSKRDDSCVMAFYRRNSSAKANIVL